jgi:hypothetical protein
MIGTEIGMEFHNTLENSVLIGDSIAYNGYGFKDNVIVGHKAGVKMSTGERNVFLGNYAGYNITNTFGNTFLGHSAGYSNTGEHNVFIGTDAGYNDTGSNNIYIGYNVGKNTSNNNVLLIDNSDTSKTLIYGEFDKDRLKVNGRLAVSTYSVNTSSVTLGNGYSFVDVDYTSTGTVTINLPTDNTEGDVLVITDTGGNASVNNITINGNGANISGSSTYMLQVSYESVQMHYHNGNWFVY